jgi:hypothetical protein
LENCVGVGVRVAVAVGVGVFDAVGVGVMSPTHSTQVFHGPLKIVTVAANGVSAPSVRQCNTDDYRLETAKSYILSLIKLPANFA